MDEEHDHFWIWIWICLIGLMCGWSCMDGTVRIASLEHRIERIEHTDAGLK